jgi:phosphoribosyl 1,2-cyclic phosphate phosphodiesterase
MKDTTTDNDISQDCPTLRVTLLGTGTSGGVPSLGCSCNVCRSTDPHDKRLRCAALIESATTRVLIDCGPDIRQQLMPFPFTPIDGILLTHLHYDHIGGIDDLRPFAVFSDIRIYADEQTGQRIHDIMPYCFGKHLYPGVPPLELHTIQKHHTFSIGDIEITPIEVMHGKMPILGFRIGHFTYITDMKTIAPTEMAYLQGVRTLVINALRFEKEHHSHQLVADAIEFSKKIGAEKTFLTHMTHQIGLHKEASKKLPSGIELAYDGLTFTVE